MNRNEFIEKIHYFNHGIKDDYNTNSIFPKDSFISVPLNEEDISISVKELKEEINKFLKENLNSEILDADLLNILGKESFTYSGLSMSYNKLYDSLMDLDIINEENDTLKIYRIEDDEGRGLYRAMEKVGKSIAEHFDFCRDKQPSPMEDGILASLFHNEAEDREKNKNWFFGFSSKQQILNWIQTDGLMEFITENNPDINIVEYEVNTTQSIKTEKQVAFKKEKSKKIKEYKLKDIEEIESLEIIKELSNKVKNKRNKRIKIS